MHKITVLFPMCGSEYIGMGKSLYDNYIEVKKIYEEANDILGFDLGNLIFYGNMKEIQRPEILYPAILTTSYVFYTIYSNVFGLRPTYMSGHGIGQISALTCAGVYKFSDSVMIAKKRGEMAADLGESSLRKDGELKRNLKAVNNFKKYVDGVQNSLSNTQIKVISHISGEAIDESDNFAEDFVKSLFKAPQWDMVCESVMRDGIYDYIEIGPSKTIGDTIRKIDDRNKVRSLDYSEDEYYCLSVFQRNKIYNIKYLLGRMLGVAVSVENKNFDDEAYKEGVLNPYKKIKKIYDEYTDDKEMHDGKYLEDSTKNLIQIMETKGADKSEIISRIKKLEQETLIDLRKYIIS